jgi:putative heme-binding domain-containing protein
MNLLTKALVGAVFAAGAGLVATAQSPRRPLENPTAADLDQGARLFASSCSRCHGLDGSGGTGPPLTRPILRRAADEATLMDVIAGGVPGTAMPASWILSEAEVARIAAYVRSLGRRPAEPLPGDPEAGRTAYSRLSCSSCHVIDGAGAAVGPELTNIGVLRGAAFLRESLFDPAAARPERAVSYEPYTYPAYVTVRVKPRGGTEIVGTKVNEDSFTIQLRDENGRLHSFRKQNLESLRTDSMVSAMPSYRNALTDREADDLVAYLMSLGAPR